MRVLEGSVDEHHHKIEEAKADLKGTAGATLWLWLTVPIAILAAVATGSELFVDGIFRGDSPSFVAQAIGQAIVTLVVVGAKLTGAGRGSGLQMVSGTRVNV